MNGGANNFYELNKKVNLDTFSRFGETFELRLMHTMLSDDMFTKSIIKSINPRFFSNITIQNICTEMLNAYHQDDIIPDLETIEYRVKGQSFNVEQSFKIEIALSQLRKLDDEPKKDIASIKNLTIDFCRNKALNLVNTQIAKMVRQEDHAGYANAEKLIREALDIGTITDMGESVFDNIEDVLTKDFRSPIPTGITHLDEIMNGGLAKQELGLIIAPFGTGKTTMLTKMANHALNMGKNVVQIFFEDTVKVIKQKHAACWTGIELNNLSEPQYKPKVLKIINERKKNCGKLTLKRMSSSDTTMKDIKNFIKDLQDSGETIDLVFLDYIDVVVPEGGGTGKDWESEGKIMREFESLLSELDIAGWTAVQGNRDSVGAEVVEANMMGGSIKKAQIGHFICSIAKTLEQKESGRATIAILKSRFGKDGLIIDDIIFDNARVKIEIYHHNKEATTINSHNKSEAQRSEEDYNNFVENFDIDGLDATPPEI